VRERKNGVVAEQEDDRIEEDSYTVDDRIGCALKRDARVAGGQGQEDQRGAIPWTAREPVESNSDCPDDDVGDQQPVLDRIDEVATACDERAAPDAREHADHGDDPSRDAALEDRLAVSSRYGFQLPGVR
jgi:hypothetical protein